MREAGFHHLIGRPLGHDVAAVDSGAGADIDDVVCHLDGVLIMLDDDHGVADVAEVTEGFEKPGVVALVQADGGFIKDIENAG